MSVKDGQSFGPGDGSHGYVFPTWEVALKEAFAGVQHAYDRRKRIVIAAHDAGLSYHTIAGAVGMSVAGVHKIAGGPRPSQEELLKARAGVMPVPSPRSERGGSE